ncbi:protoporphyrinogen oxidase [Chitinophaga nivalis]|uniref:Coproporphyrinogen III oxidase n=1 Tax=Chitinophaga nivalis TaxID=2991709 RepID=A0ABT3IG39_9BACT|nr:protoporphyrinogen oxidase [Chitinophaga nivalis]MCW3467397.1 protoporphyrinogen oxidase [Chitinophaga nivalis]MCW3482911.1 protoporphyrinogen oxidase [Chitinophaga nivalis]
MSQQPVVIIGAGISGLSIAYELQKQQVPYLLLEASDHTGGVLQSFHQDGFELDAGANTLAASPELLAFIRELGLEQDILEAGAASKKRFLVRNNQLHGVSPHPVKILGSAYLSRAAKWRLFTERFRKAAAPQGEETVTDFVSRRFNKEIADYVFDPVLSGIYAGNPDLMSIGEVLPALPRWEKEYGSVTKGLMKDRGAMGGRKIISFKGGNQRLTNRLQELLTTPVRFNCTVDTISVSAGGYTIQATENGAATTLQAANIIFTAPAYRTAQQINTLDTHTAALLQQVHYPRMGVLHLGFEAAAMQQPLEGFGFLVPNAEKKHFLGAICNSAIFPAKAPQGKMLLTVFVGGARQEHYFDEIGAAALQTQAIAEIKSLLQLSAGPVLQRFSEWKQAIPQLNVGHAKLRSAVTAFEKKYPGLYISGNYLQGVAIPALLQHAATLAASLRKN